MPDLLADLRFAWRRWTKRRTFAITAILTLALGIGAATAIFSVVNGVLLRPLPWKDPDRLVVISVARPAWRNDAALAAFWNRGDLSWPMFDALREKRRTLEAVGTYDVSQLVFGGARGTQGTGDAQGSQDTQGSRDTQNELVTGLRTSASFLPMLGTQPHLGRFFSAEEDLAASDAVIVTHEIWVRRFGASRGILGTRVLLNGAPRAIVGVLPAGFRLGSVVPEFLIPYGNERDRGISNHFMRGVARLQPGITTEQAEADIAPVIQTQEGSNTEVKLPHVVALERDQRGELRRPLWMLMAASVGLLLIACANVGGLLLGEARVRRHEIAVRTAVGGSRSRLVRQLMVEALALSSVAGLLGLAIAWYLTPLLLTLSPLGLPPVESGGAPRIDPGVLAFAALVTVATTVLFGLSPSLTLLSGTPGGTLVEGGRNASLQPQRAHGALVTIQIALAAVLLVTASLLGETVVRLSRVDIGFDSANLLVATVRSTTRLPTQALRAARMSETIAKLSSLPGVVSVAATANAPFSGDYGTSRIKVEGKSHERDPDAVRQLVTDDYFALMRIPILKGQSLASSGSAVAVVSETFERQLMDGDALGKRFEWNKEWHTVVGVVPDAKQRAYTDRAAPMFYVLNRGIGNFMVRTAVPPESLMPAVREAIVSQDRGAVVSRLTTMDTLLARSTAEERYRALLSSLFGSAALVLSAIGIYGIIARSVTDRLREFGVRSALGATPRNIRILVFGQTARLVGFGLLLGIPTALVTSRAIGAMLYGVSPTAPHTFLVVIAVLAAAAALGTLAPVHRAGRVDPSVALRQS
jgi:putative ABC transport system permease protein